MIVDPAPVDNTPNAVGPTAAPTLGGQVQSRIRSRYVNVCGDDSVKHDKPRGACCKRYFVRGRVQGVGFRYFVERAAEELGIDGYTRNLDDGRVEVYAIGPPDKLSELAGRLWKGPRWSEVRGVEEQEAPMLQLIGFQIRH